MLRFVDLFAGTGGIRLALAQACADLGITAKCVLSSEIDKNACSTYALNFDEDPYLDIRARTDFPDFDFLLAGFPCQAFSYAGKRAGFGDTRGTLFFDVERILKAKQPKYFLLENVRGLVTHDKGRTLNTILRKLRRLGYATDYLLLNSSNFGVPQNRVRIYIVGVLQRDLKLTLRSDLGAPDTHKFDRGEDGKAVTVGDILENSPDPKYSCTDDFVKRLRRVVGNDLESLHGYRLIDYRGGKALHSWELAVKGECTQREIRFMNLLISNRRKKIFGTHQDGKSLTRQQIETFYPSEHFEKVTERLREKGYLSLKNGKYNPVCGNMSFEVFKFLDPNSISITLTASDANRLGVIQKNHARRITPRECARLQGYPDSFELLENDSAVYKQMGNAVSVPVVRSVLTDFLTLNYE